LIDFASRLITSDLHGVSGREKGTILLTEILRMVGRQEADWVVPLRSIFPTKEAGKGANKIFLSSISLFFRLGEMHTCDGGWVPSLPSRTI
jgi:hypothetical protein